MKTKEQGKIHLIIEFFHVKSTRVYFDLVLGGNETRTQLSRSLRYCEFCFVFFALAGQEFKIQTNLFKRCYIHMSL